MIVLADTREPWPHPWAALLPEGWVLERASLETGDFCLGSHLDGVLVERKSPSDMASCVGSNRERFERELKRGRYCRLIVVVEGSLSDVVVAGRKLHANSIMGTLAAWTVRYAPFVFCGSQRLAASFAFRLLASQLPEDERRRALQARRALPQEVSQQGGALSGADAPPPQEEDCTPPF